MPTPAVKGKVTLPKLVNNTPKPVGTTAPSSSGVVDPAKGTERKSEKAVEKKGEKLPKVSRPQRGSAAAIIVPKGKATSSAANGNISTVAAEEEVVNDSVLVTDAAADASSIESLPPAVHIEIISESQPVSDSTMLPEIAMIPVVVEPVVERIINGNGNVKLIYEQYDELFPIIDGSTTQEIIDDVYCLSFVMPDCLVHLSVHNPQKKRELEVNGDKNLYLLEKPLGTYQNMEADCTYYIFVEQKAEFLVRDQEKMKIRALSMQGATIRQDSAARISKDDGRVIESCSCIYGNPCVDEYGCKDWGNRATIATANGWKGF